MAWRQVAPWEVSGGRALHGLSPWPEDEASAHVSGSNGSPLTQWNSSPTLRRPIQGSLRVNLYMNSCTKERGKAQSQTWAPDCPHSPRLTSAWKTGSPDRQTPREARLAVPQK